jgi:purine-binding chemotaxis protein CheW
MRPLPVEPVAGAPPFVVGVSLIRGAPTPVARLSRILADTESQATRYITVRVGSRLVALAVDSVEGVRGLPEDLHEQLPPLLGETAKDAIAQLAILDGDLLTILNTGRLIPDAAWSTLAAGGIGE